MQLWFFLNTSQSIPSTQGRQHSRTPKSKKQRSPKEVGKQGGSREEEKISVSFESVNEQRTRMKDESHDISSHRHEMGNKCWRKLSPMNPKRKINKFVWSHNMKDTQTKETDKMLFSLMSCFGGINIIWKLQNDMQCLFTNSFWCRNLFFSVFGLLLGLCIILKLI